MGRKHLLTQFIWIHFMDVALRKVSLQKSVIWKISTFMNILRFSLRTQHRRDKVCVTTSHNFRECVCLQSPVHITNIICNVLENWWVSFNCHPLKFPMPMNRINPPISPFGRKKSPNMNSIYFQNVFISQYIPHKWWPCVWIWFSYLLVCIC